MEAAFLPSAPGGPSVPDGPEACCPHFWLNLRSQSAETCEAASGLPAVAEAEPLQVVPDPGLCLEGGLGVELQPDRLLEATAYALVDVMWPRSRGRFCQEQLGVLLL